MVSKRAKGLANKVARSLPVDLGVGLIRLARLPQNITYREEPVYHDDPLAERRKTNAFYKAKNPRGYGERPDYFNLNDRLEAVKNFVRGSVVEIGCADGFFTRNFAKSGHDAIGIDFSEHYVKLAKEHGKKEGLTKAKFMLGTVEKIPLKDRSCDTVFLGEILEHVKDVNVVLDESLRILKDSGIIIITLPTHRMRTPDHRRTVTPRALRKYLEGKAEIERMFIVNINCYACIAAKK